MRGSLEQILPGIKDDSEAECILEPFKRPRGKAWETKTFKLDSPGLQEGGKAGGNYGIVAGSLHQYNGQEYKLFIMDEDNPSALAQHFDDYTESMTQQQLECVKEYVAQSGDYHPCKTLKSYIPGSGAWDAGGSRTRD